MHPPIPPSPRHPRRHRAPLEPLEPRTLLTTFTVSSPADDGPNTLRQAILLANASPGHDTIQFHLPGSTVTLAPLTPLPDITGPTLLDGAYHGLHPDGTPMVRIMPRYSVFADTLRLVGASGSTVRGLAISGTSSAVRVVGGANVSIEGNHIGDPGPDDAPFGSGDGVVLEGAVNCRVGGTLPGQRNVIAGTGAAVAIRPAAPLPYGVSAPANHTIQGNYLGTTPAGDARGLANVRGVEIISSTGVLVGGADPAARNVISHSTDAGVYVLTGQATIRGNYIGTDASGRRALRGGRGVFVTGVSSGLLIGGSAPGEGNVISAHVVGVFFFGDEVNDNVIAGNLIGLDAEGAAGLPGGETGVIIGSGRRNVIGGDTPAARNVIAAQSWSGARVEGKHNLVRHNYIGTDRTGRLAVPNGMNPPRPPGPDSEGGHGLFLGGANTPDDCNEAWDNLISGNSVGVRLVGDGNVLRRNLIGTDASGAAPLPNTLGGVYVRGGAGIGLLAAQLPNHVGGPAPDHGNVIAASGGFGVYVEMDSSPALVENNRIGVGSATATHPAPAMGNLGGGVVVAGRAGNLITRNVIAHNGQGGVILKGPSGTSTAVVANSIHSNAGLGIDLTPTAPGVLPETVAPDGVTPNDLGDDDLGPNSLLNHPVLASVATSDTGAIVRGEFQSTPGGRFRIEFFSSPAADPSGHGEGATFLGSIELDTDGRRTPFAAVGLPPLPAGSVVTATASKVGGAAATETSEFSNAVTVPAPDTTGPRVTAVFVRGQDWPPRFLNHLHRTGLGSPQFGYALPTGPGADAPLPWTNVDEITFQFSEPVLPPSGSFTLRGTRGGDYALDIPTLDPSTNTLTYQLAAPIGADRLTLLLRDGITDWAGNPLDGDRTPAQPLPSGNGVRGGPFTFALSILPADTTRDGAVTPADLLHLRPAQTTYAGDPTYSPFADPNADGHINVLDTLEARRRQSTTLPPVSSTAAAAPPPTRRDRPPVRESLLYPR